MSRDKIIESLGLSPIEILDDDEATPEEIEEIFELEAVEQAETNTNQAEVVKDIETAQANIRYVMEKTTEVFDTMTEVANNSETARDFEVVANMMKAIIDANKEFVNMSEKKKYAKEELPAQMQGGNGNTTTNITNNLILTTTELLKMKRGEKS